MCIDGVVGNSDAIEIAKSSVGKKAKAKEGRVECMCVREKEREDGRADAIELQWELSAGQ